MKRLAEKIAVLGTENSKGQFVKIKINVQTQRAKEFQKSRENAKGEHISRTGQYRCKARRRASGAQGNYDAQSFHVLTSLFIKDMILGWVKPAYKLWVVIDSKSEKAMHPTPVLLPGKSHGWRRLVGCSSWGR